MPGLLGAVIGIGLAGGFVGFVVGMSFGALFF